MPLPIHKWKFSMKTDRILILKWKKAKNIKSNLTSKIALLQTVRKRIIFIEFWNNKILKILMRKISLFWLQLNIKNCKVKGNFGEVDILTDAAVPADFETLAQKQATTENTVSGLDYTAFMINKQNQSKLSFFLVQLGPGTVWFGSTDPCMQRCQR